MRVLIVTFAIGFMIGFCMDRMFSNTYMMPQVHEGIFKDAR